MKYPIKTRVVRRSIPLLFALGFSTLAVVGAAEPQAHKVEARNAATESIVLAHGGKLIADYGSYKLFELDELAPQISNRPDAQWRDDYNRILLNAGEIDSTGDEARALRKKTGDFHGKKLHLIQLAGPPKGDWYDAIVQTGVRIVDYIPHNAYLVYGDARSLAAIQSLAQNVNYIQWDGEYADDYKIHPKAKPVDAKGKARNVGTDTFCIQLLDDPQANAATRQLIETHKLSSARREFKTLHFINVIVRLPAASLKAIAAQPEVVSIQPYLEHKKFDERQNQIVAGNLSGTQPSGPGYLAWLAAKGFTQAQFTASGFAVDVSDSGVDNGTTAPGHFGLYQSGNPLLSSRVIYNRLEGTPNSGSTLQGCDGHGTINSHIIGGYNDRATGFPHTDAAGFHYGLGVCPFVRIGSSVIFDPDEFTSPDYPDLQSRAYNDGARISANSWGANVGGAYDVDSQVYDALVRDAQPSASAFPTAGNQEMTIVFAAGNAGSDAQSIGSPGTAKNVICVGAAENVHSHSTANGGNSGLGNDGCTTPDSEANSANDIATFSSRGPCSDGRAKPDIVAPGTHITGGVGQASGTTNGNGSALACFSAEGVCGLPNGGTVGSPNNFFPLGQQFYTTSSGTSHSTPAVAGACALIRQNFINLSLSAPSPAMTKAYLMNSARYLDGAGANDSLPSQNQGMGEANLGFAFDGVARILRDQLAPDKFTVSGQTRTFQGAIVDPTKPFRVTLAWTDAPGSTTGSAFKNNLDLTVIAGGNTYKGNVFSGANSTVGGNADTRNNVESVYLPAGITGNFLVTITATSINSDGVPNEAPSLDQDFALVVYNGVPSTGPLLSSVGFNIVAESCAVQNSAIDPGETVTVNIALNNVGTANTTNLVATLLATNGINSPGAPQSYGALAASGAAITQAFSFTANGVCGSNVTATLALSDNGIDLGRVSLTMPLGTLVASFTENFDALASPALPPGWTTSQGGGQALWVTTTSSSDTPPNAAFSNDASTIGSNELVSPALTLPAAASQLTFRHRYGFETHYDGGVLEIKIGNGAFTDILQAGGSFVSGGYVQILSSDNSLGARLAWTGTSATFSTVIVNLPPSASGQTVQFRWRVGTDFSVSGTGWWMDSISISSPSCCSNVVPPTITAEPQNQTVVQGDPAGFSVSATGQNPLRYQWYFNSAPIGTATNATYSILSATSNHQGNYFVVVTNAGGSATSSVATLSVIVAPVLLNSPTNLTAALGTTANFSVTAMGASPLLYQWQFEGANVPNGNASNLSKTNLQIGDAGLYRVIVSNFAGSVTSAPAMLAIATDVFNGALIGWDVSGQSNFGISPLPPTTHAPHVVVNGLTRGPGVATVGSPAARAWGGNGFDSASAAAAASAGDYATFSLTPDAGYKISLSAVSRFDYRRSGSGPTNGLLQVQVGADPFVNVATNAYSSPSSSGAALAAIDLSTFPSLQNIGPGTNIVFRIVNHGGIASGGTWYIYDVATSAELDLAVQGTVAPLTLPPAAVPVLSLSGIVSNQVQLTLTGTAGYSYAIESSTNLAGTNWTLIYSGAPPLSFSEPASSSPRFYRGKVAP